MTSLLDEKLSLLCLYYPDYERDALKGLLLLCSGDVEKTRELLSGPKPKKRQHTFQAPIAKRVAKTNLAKITLLGPKDVEAHLGKYASFYPNFFDKSLADALLDELVEKKDRFYSTEFHLFGNKCRLHHGVATFAAPDSERPEMVYNGLRMRDPIPYSPDFAAAAEKIEAHVDKVMRNKPKLPFQRKERWRSEYCVANYYEKLDNHLDWHSDRLSHIGPHNYIASVLLGSTRVFRLRHASGKGPTFEIPLPHNSLFLMHAGCQEEYKHCVSSMSKSIQLHPKVGSSRFSLTFRHYPAEFIKRLPKCKCNIGMVLRRSREGRYFWLCESVYQNKECGTFHWADFARPDMVSQGTVSTWLP